jgi:Protein of unknown function (DUF4232)
MLNWRQARAVAFGSWVLAGLVTLAGLGVSFAPSAQATGTPACATSGLVVWMQTEGNGTAGPIYYQLQLTNLSGHTCTLKGYPGVSAVGLGGRQLGRAASRDTSSKPKLVTLANGTAAKVTLRLVQGGFFPTSSCKPVTAAGLRVFPPGQSSSKVIPFPFEACSRSGPAFLTVGSARKE